MHARWSVEVGAHTHQAGSTSSENQEVAEDLLDLIIESHGTVLFVNVPANASSLSMWPLSMGVESMKLDVERLVPSKQRSSRVYHENVLIPKPTKS